MKRSVPILICLAALFALVACGGGSSVNTSASQANSQVFVVAEDAPVSSVVGFNVTINSIMLNNSSTSVQALSTPTAVDFGRLMGLRSLLAFNTIAPGTYTSATFTFETSNPAPVISYVDFTNPSSPTVTPLTGTFSNPKVTVSFPAGSPLVVGANGLAGLHIDFNLRNSLAVNSSNQITGSINPSITVQAVSASDELGQITEFTGNIVSVGSSSFVMQGPYGFQKTIDVNNGTQFNGSNSLSTMTVDGIVSIIGAVQADGSILASNVELINTDQAFISGRVLAVNPTSGPVQTVTMWIGEEIGASSVYPVDTVQTINIASVNRYDICFFDNLLAQQLFNNASLVVGQRIFIGGVVSSGTFTPKMVSLRRQGVVGSLVANSVTVTGGTGSNLGSFQMVNDVLMSYSATRAGSTTGAFTVLTSDKTNFININGLAGLSVAGSTNLLSRGLVFKNASNGQPEVVAGRVRVLP